MQRWLVGRRREGGRLYEPSRLIGIGSRDIIPPPPLLHARRRERSALATVGMRRGGGGGGGIESVLRYRRGKEERAVCVAVNKPTATLLLLLL